VSERITKVYLTQCAEGFEWLLPVNRDDNELLVFDGTPRAASWRPIKMKRLTRDDTGNPLAPNDFPPGCEMAVSSAAKTLLGPVLEEAGELLPLDCPDGDFWALNVTRLVDALDEEQSELLRSSQTGRILMIHRYSFRSNCLGPEIFKLPQAARAYIYVTEAFVNRVRATPLKGLDFKLLWAPN
jgi:hypothetical protein